MASSFALCNGRLHGKGVQKRTSKVLRQQSTSGNVGFDNG